MNITLTWAAFDGHVDQMRLEGGRPVRKSTVATISIPDCFAEDHEDRDLYICELLFKDTNTYEGPFWNRLSPILPDDRTHTALSVGDFVTVEDRTYRCDSFGWSLT